MALAALGAVAVVLLPGLLSSHRAYNERMASTQLKMLASAEADFRANDRDGNRVHDFWTADVSGLYYLTSGADGKEIRLIEVDVADADAKPLLPRPKGSIPDEGYRYAALERDGSVAGDSGLYKRDTDQSGRKVHHESKFGFCAFPADAGSGKCVFFVNENNIVFREAGTQPREVFPSNEELKSPGSRTR